MASSDTTKLHAGLGQLDKFHVRLVEGRFQTLRRLTSWPLIALFFGLVWVEVGGEPWLLFSFEQRRIVLFGTAFSWLDLPILAGLLISGAFLLFLLAVTVGRVWCGFACPQSIWTWLYIRIEDLTEGRAHQRRKWGNGELSAEQWLRRCTKHALWLLLAGATALTFTGYFVPMRPLVAQLLQADLPAHTSVWLLAMTALTYLNAGLVREKICLHACPYSRFQSVMFDRDTVTVSYDEARGEPRGSRRQAAASRLGDCVDCSLCVQVCPTGIDIRQGLQAACIDCAACVDACDTVMDKLQRPRGLIRFASAAQLAGEPSTRWRPKAIGYGLMLLLALGYTASAFWGHTRLAVAIKRDRGALYTQPEPELVCNRYQVKLEGFERELDAVSISLAPGSGFALRGENPVSLQRHNANWLPYQVCGQNPGATRVPLTLVFSSGGEQSRKKTVFIAPANGQP